MLCLQMFHRATCLVLRLHQSGKLLSQLFQLWKVVVHNVRVGRIARDEVLVIIFSRVETLQGNHIGDDSVVENFGLLELLDLRLSNPLGLRCYRKSKSGIAYRYPGLDD